jgi:son of sevenless-like protein
LNHHASRSSVSARALFTLIKYLAHRSSGLYLTQLTFIQDGNHDTLDGGLTNFSKRNMAAEVINDMKRWQARPYNLTPVPGILGFLEDSLSQYTESERLKDEFWEISLEREPREREDEKMARLLQESGFL